MSGMQDAEIAIERGKEYFEDLKKHLKNIQKIMTEEDIAELSRPEAQKLLAQNIIKHQTYVNNFLEQNLIKALSTSNPQDAKPIQEEEKKEYF